MPNRIIKETIRTSKKVNQLSDFDYRVWSYLITYVDDYGRGSADPELLKGLCFPRRKGVTETQIQKALDNLANTGMVNLYYSDGEPFFYFPNWDKHQQVRAKKSKFPEPDGICNQMIANDSKCLRNPIQSESNPNPNTNTKRARAEELASDFEEAWKAYPRKEGDKDRAKKEYIKAREEGIEKETILSGVLLAAEYYKTIEPRYIPMGATWFNQRRWQDEHIQKKPTLKDVAPAVDTSKFWET